MWVCVSDDFDVQLLVKNVLESASGQAPPSTQMDALKNLLHEKITGRRYLLELDDVWNEDVNKWSNFIDLLSGGARGSKIVITTRLRTVAGMSRPIAIHELRGLFENEAWSLFKEMAFKQGQVPNPSHEAIGREIVAKCGGVPLAIRTIGGMLYYREMESEWLLFRNEELSKIDVYKNDILPVLMLSYNHLPSHYKHCFAYCSLYPKDFEIPVEKLIHLWKAQGYLRSTDPNQCLQDVGLGYFLDLFRMSFFQDVRKDMCGNIESCKMHDLMHDLAILVAGENFSSSHSKMTCINDKARHLSLKIDRNSLLQDFPSLMKAKMTRTLLPFFQNQVNPVNVKKDELHALFCNLRSLRTLKLSYMGISSLPSSISKLKHLRHLDLSNNEDINKLPDSITDLFNLQVLILSHCLELIQLPESITKLGNLAHLDNNECPKLTHIPRGIGQLTRLEKLSSFVIAKDYSVSKHCGGLDELHALNNLRGVLEIKNLRYVRNAELEFKAAELHAKQYIQKLTLRWNSYADDYESDAGNDEMGLEALRPHQSLKEVSVIYYRGVRPPSWVTSLSNLVSICFKNCNSIKWLPAFNQLPFLKRLRLSGLAELERIELAVNGGSFSFFPSLTDIHLTECPNLKGFLRHGADFGTEELPCFPCVSELSIGGCAKLAYMPHFPELKELELMNNGVDSSMQIFKNLTTSSAFAALSQLQHMRILKTEEFPDELLQYLTSLQQLHFAFCDFESLSSGEQWRSLQVLKSVTLEYMPNLVSLPKGVQFVTALKSLDIHECPRLKSWMDNLNTLQYLRISGCPQLSDRCKNNIAEDWPRISHIPHISIDGKPIQRNGCYLL